jgi:heat shock protein HtpX
VTLQEQIRSNRWHSVVLIGGFVVLILILAGLLAAALNVWLGAFALAGALVYAVFAVASSRGMVASMTGAQELPPDELRSLRRLVENVSIAAGLPVTPEVRIVADPAPNAFATGLTPGKSFVGITTGLLHTMPQRELEAVIAHEISHVRNRDTRLMTLAVVFAGVIALVADIAFRSLAFGGGRSRDRGGGPIVLILAVVGFLLAPIAATLLRLSLSRRREYLADATAAEITNDPEGMAMALRRLEDDTTTVRHADSSVAHLWIESPTHRVEDGPTGTSALAGLFDTHPPLQSRIEALEQAGGFQLPAALPADRPFIDTADEPSLR